MELYKYHRESCCLIFGPLVEDFIDFLEAKVDETRGFLDIRGYYDEE